MQWDALHKFWMFDDPRSYGARQLMLGAAEGLKRNGKNVHLHPYDPQDPYADHKLRQSLLAFEPDAILLANHPSTLFFKNMRCEPLNCPVFVWIFDDPFIMGAEPFDENDIVWAADPSFINGAKLRGARDVFFIPVAAPCDIRAESMSEYQTDIAYVGAAFRIPKAREQIGEQTAQYLDRIIAIKLKHPEQHFESLLKTHLLNETSQVQLSGQLAYYLYTESNRKHRLLYLHSLAGLHLKLYGNETWKAEIAGSALASCYSGSIEPLHDYPNLIASTKVNVNLRSMQGISAPVQRDFLMPAAGGFMLSSQRINQDIDWQIYDPNDRFKLDQFVWSPRFSTPDEAVELSKQYIHSDPQRTEWIDHAQRCIHNHHTFAHRIQQAGEIMNEWQRESL